MERLKVLKTYKLYIGGKFPRTESGRYYPLENKNGDTIANVCLGSRKDFRNAVVAARKAFGDWSSRSHFNRSQIVYRIAEMIEGRSQQFVDEMVEMGMDKAQAQKEVEQSIDRIIYYAGWCDKYQQIFSSVNPVASSHFNFSALEPMGVVTAMAPEKSPLLGLLSVILPAIVGGNSVIVLADEKLPLCAITLAEVLATSDLPGGVVNVITGQREELVEHISTHMDVNAVIYTGEKNDQFKKIKENAALNVKRVLTFNGDWSKEGTQNPYWIKDLQEVKTTWHPIENIGGVQGGY